MLELAVRDELTQEKIGARVGVSQMQVSRDLRLARDRLRDVCPRSVSPSMPSGSHESMTAFRYGLPIAILVGGLALLAIGGDAATGAGIVLVGVAALVFLANVLARLAVHSQDDRDEEERARRYFSRHGRWPHMR